MKMLRMQNLDATATAEVDLEEGEDGDGKVTASTALLPSAPVPTARETSADSAINHQPSAQDGVVAVSTPAATTTSPATATVAPAAAKPAPVPASRLFKYQADDKLIFAAAFFVAAINGAAMPVRGRERVLSPL